MITTIISRKFYFILMALNIFSMTIYAQNKNRFSFGFGESYTLASTFNKPTVQYSSGYYPNYGNIKIKQYLETEGQLAINYESVNDNSFKNTFAKNFCYSIGYERVFNKKMSLLLGIDFGPRMFNIFYVSEYSPQVGYYTNDHIINIYSDRVFSIPIHFNHNNQIYKRLNLRKSIGVALNFPMNDENYYNFNPNLTVKAEKATFYPTLFLGIEPTFNLINDNKISLFINYQQGIVPIMNFSIIDNYNNNRYELRYLGNVLNFGFKFYFKSF